MKVLVEEKLGVTFANKETVLELNGSTIEAFPSNHLDAFRSLTNPKFILLDEADFFLRSRIKVRKRSRSENLKYYLKGNRSELDDFARLAIYTPNRLSKEYRSIN
jgi:hypothetical protein